MQEDTGLTNSEFTLVFPTGYLESTICTSIPIIVDSLLEGDEQFTVTVVDAGTFASISTSSVTTVTIVHGNSELLHYTLTFSKDTVTNLFIDVALVSLDLSSPVCSEGNGSVDVCAVISGLPAGGLGTDITVEFDVIGSTAGIEEDTGICVVKCSLYSFSGC